MKNNNRFLRILHVLCCLIMATSVCGAVDEEGIPQLVGDGSTENPYQIKNADDLYWFAEHVNHGNENMRNVNLCK